MCAATICSAVANILVAYLICPQLGKPSSRGHCGNTNFAFLSIIAIDPALVIAIFALPIPSLYKLQTSRHTKMACGATFALGVFTIAASLLRLGAILRNSFKTHVAEAAAGTALWGTVELTVGIIVACAMNLRPLLDRLVTSIKGWFSEGQLTSLSRRTTTKKSSSEGPVSSCAEDPRERFSELEQLQPFPSSLEDNARNHTRQHYSESD